MLFQVWRYISRFWILLHLLVLSAEDIRDGNLSFHVILELLVTGWCRAVWYGQQIVWMPGALLLLLGKLTGEKIGMEDGWLNLALGMWLSYEEIVQILVIGVLSGTLYGIMMKKREIPLVPFLTLGFALVQGV